MEAKLNIVFDLEMTIRLVMAAFLGYISSAWSAA
jgi:hypothetical protein